MNKFKKPERNFNGIKHEKIRKLIDHKFNQIHDELTDCYYKKKPFRQYGVLDKQKFDKLHGLIFLLRDIKFHNYNKSLPAKEQFPEDEYNTINELDGEKNIEKAIYKIEELRQEGLELFID